MYGAPQIFIPGKVPDTPQQTLKDMRRRARPRHRTTTHGSHVLDLVALEKAICLCSSCSGKFHAWRHGYVKASRPPFQGGVIAICDACEAYMERCTMFLKEM
jgi:hypothetical protein